MPNFSRGNFGVLAFFFFLKISSLNDINLQVSVAHKNESLNLPHPYKISEVQELGVCMVYSAHLLSF